MTREQPAPSHERLTGFAAEVGLDYHLDRTRGGNTFDAHRLIQLGKARGVQDAVKERLMRAYFTDAESIDDHETLVRLADWAGVGRHEARAVLASDEYADAVRDDEELARRIGING